MVVAQRKKSVDDILKYFFSDLFYKKGLDIPCKLSQFA